MFFQPFTLIQESIRTDVSQVSDVSQLSSSTVSNFITCELEEDLSVDEQSDNSSSVL